MFKIKRTESYYAIKITALNEFEQGAYYFFSYRFCSAFIGKEETEKRSHIVAEAKGVEES